MSDNSTALPVSGIVPSEPESYNPERFANRERELRLIDRKVEEGRHGSPITQPLVHIWGVAGIGKTWLLCELAKRYEFEPEKKPNERKAAFTLPVDFRQWRLSVWEPQSIVNFLSHMVDDLHEQLGRPMLDAQTELRDFKQCVQKVETEEAEITGLMERFADIVNRLSFDFVPVLLFDSVETLDEDLFFSLESHLLEPIVRTDRTVTVVAGRREIPRWREFSVRQRLVKWRLEAFSLEDTLEQLDKRRFSREGKIIYPFSFGHPYVTQVLGQKLVEWAGPRPITPEFEKEHEPQILELLAAVEDMLLDVGPELREILRILSILRKFNIEAARYLLSQIPKDSRLRERYSQKADAYYLNLFDELEDTNLVWWSTEKRGYVLSYTVRRIMNRRLQMQDPQEFARRHHVALELYREWIGAYPKNCGPFVIEALYHLTNEMDAKSPEEIGSEVEDLLAEVLIPESFTADGANAMLQALRRDREFQGETIIPREVFDRAIEYIRQFLDGLAESNVHNEERLSALHPPSVSKRQGVPLTRENEP